MTERKNDETPAPEEWTFEPQDARAERAERMDVLRRLARRLYNSYIPTEALAALLDEGEAPLWAFEILPHLANKEEPFRVRDKKALSFVGDLNDAIDQLFDDLKRPPTQKEVCALLGEQRGVEADGIRGTISRLLNRKGKMIWDPVIEMHEPDSIGETDGMKLSEYIKWRTSPDVVLWRKNPEEWEKRRRLEFFAMLDEKENG